MVVLRIHEPGRHLLSYDSRFHGFGPGPGVLIRDQRHGRDFAGAMAVLTVLLQDRKNVLIERDRGAGILGRRGANCNYRRQQRGKADAFQSAPPFCSCYQIRGLGIWL